MEDRRRWIELDHPLLSVRQQCILLDIHRSSIYYTSRPKMLSDEKLELLRLVDEFYTEYAFFGTE